VGEWILVAHFRPHVIFQRLECLKLLCNTRLADMYERRLSASKTFRTLDLVTSHSSTFSSQRISSVTTISIIRRLLIVLLTVMAAFPAVGATPLAERASTSFDSSPSLDDPGWKSIPRN
jgi:hypothetical protein